MSREALTAHFDGVVAGGVVDVSIARSKGGGMKRTAVVTFATSADAQSAKLRGNTFNGQQLTMDIYQPSGARAVAPTSIRESKGVSFGPRVSTDGVDQDHAGLRSGAILLACRCINQSLRNITMRIGIL
jgi:RNA recognition motif. (a.k.a. RRM, RBD, or RNP domain)